MDVWSCEERYNPKLTCERIRRVAPSSMKITERRLNWYGHVSRLACEEEGKVFVLRRMQIH